MEHGHNPHGYDYLASPYSSNSPTVVQDRVAATSRATALFWGDGRPVYSPIVHSHQLVLHSQKLRDAQFNHNFWLKMDESFLEPAHGFILFALSGWDRSKGVLWELDWWGEHRGGTITVARLRDWDSLEVHEGVENNLVTLTERFA